MIFILAGPRVAFRNAIFGGVILAMIGLVEQIMIKMQMKEEYKKGIEMQEEEARKQTEKLKEVRPGNFLFFKM